MVEGDMEEQGWGSWGVCFWVKPWAEDSVMEVEEEEGMVVEVTYLLDIHNYIFSRPVHIILPYIILHTSFHDLLPIYGGGGGDGGGGNRPS